MVTVGSILVGTNAGTTPLAVGDLVMIIQMQDAQYSNVNGVTFGDGATGRGWTAINDAGKYEFRRIASIAGTNITLDQNLANTYTRSAPSAGNTTTENGNRRFQVIRVPQFSSVTLSGTINPPAWNGETGGVWVIDVAGTLNMGGATVDASGLGFRGGGGIPNTENLAATDYVNTTAVDTTLPAGATCANDGVANNRGSFKGEGISGTPRFVRNATAANTYAGTYAFIDLGLSGYANGGDQARGAPGNAGGGGTEHNAGGGGGSNVGSGGLGGNTFGFYNQAGTCVSFSGGNPNPFLGCNGDGSRPMGGLGGGTLASSINSLIMGGGGGAGDNNNACDNPATLQAAGGNGGGVIFIRAGSISGSGTLLSNGQNGYPGGRDGTGGGGAGGTVVVLTSTNNPALTIRANGGQGGNTGWSGSGGVAGPTQLRGGETQGPGGGGGGGSVVNSSNISFGTAPTFTGGASGAVFPSVTTSIFNAYGSGSGGGNSATVPFVPTAQSLAANCLPQLVVSKVTTSPLIIGPTLTTTATYQINVSNTGTGGAAGVALSDILPTPFTLTSTVATINSVSVAGPSPATANSPGSATPVIGTAGGTVANSFVVPPGGNVTATFSVKLNTTTFATYQNPATAVFSDPFRTATTPTITPGGNYSIGGTVGGSNYASASSTAEDVKLVAGTTSLTISKTDGVANVVAGSTTSYTITVANLGPTAAPGATLTDPPAAGLSCTSVTCAVSAGTATCPASPTVAALQSTGLQITPTFNANSTVTFKVTCSVTATGQ